MQFVILGFLLLMQMSLYDLHRAFAQGVSLFYSASLGSLQRALRQLVDAGHVVSSSSPGDPRGKKLHTITPEGRAAWHAWMHEPVTGADAETTVLARVFFLGLVDDAAERAAIIAVLRARIADDLAGLEAAAAGIDARDVPAEHAALFRYQRATLDYGIRAHELAARWLDELGSAPRVRG